MPMDLLFLLPVLFVLCLGLLVRRTLPARRRPYSRHHRASDTASATYADGTSTTDTLPFFPSSHGHDHGHGQHHHGDANSSHSGFDNSTSGDGSGGDSGGGDSGGGGGGDGGGGGGGD